MGWPYFFPRILALKNCVLVTLQGTASDLTASEAIARCHYHVACGLCHRLLPPASLHEWPTAQASSESAPQQRRPHTPYLAGWLTVRLTRWGSKRWASVELKRDPHALVFTTLLLLTKQTPSKILIQRLSLFWMCFMNQTSTASTCLCIEYRRNKAASVSNLIIISLRLLATSCKATVC